MSYVAASSSQVSSHTVAQVAPASFETSTLPHGACVAAPFSSTSLTEYSERKLTKRTYLVFFFQVKLKKHEQIVVLWFRADNCAFATMILNSLPSFSQLDCAPTVCIKIKFL